MDRINNIAEEWAAFAVAETDSYAEAISALTLALAKVKVEADLPTICNGVPIFDRKALNDG